jgi:hypothetical protein
MEANASSKAVQSWSRPLKMLPSSFRSTIGHKCSMGFKSGDIGGQKPLFSSLTRFRLNQACVVMAR